VSQIEQIEDTMAELGMTGGFEDLLPTNVKMGKKLHVLAYALAKGDHPDLTYEQAGKIVVNLVAPNGDAPLDDGS
jgi:hypothetical protein